MEIHSVVTSTPEHLKHDFSSTEEGLNTSWAGALPSKQGLYDPEFEKDACGVGFAAHMKGVASHKIVIQARSLLCNLVHRGAVGADSRDGDGAGVMTSIPHSFFIKHFEREQGFKLPKQGQYAVGNIFIKPDDEATAQTTQALEQLADSLDLRVLGWREVPRDSSLLGPVSSTREPRVVQPFIVLKAAYGDGCAPKPTFQDEYNDAVFQRQLYILRKRATHTMDKGNWFYLCSLSNQNIVYKGQLTPAQVYDYYYDLLSSDYEAHFALVHSRFSTNTFPSWDRAQPFRWMAHNGEINTIRGNKNWMKAREGTLKSDLFGDELDSLLPVIEHGGSDSAALDNVLELLVMNGVLTLPEAVALLIPESWQRDDGQDPRKQAFYRWAACMIEPWDGPALVTFADDRYCGASLDRNGLRPCRYYVTDDDCIICASEVGAIDIPPQRIVRKGRLGPGRMLLVDTVAGRLIEDDELKRTISSRSNFADWVETQQITLPGVMAELASKGFDITTELAGIKIFSDPLLKAFGYTRDELTAFIGPMATESREALGSMADGTPLACLSSQPRLLFEYFRQMFAQVTNPPIDPIREGIVMSLEAYVGPQGNLLEVKPEQCRRLLLPSPVLSLEEYNALRLIGCAHDDWAVQIIDITFPRCNGVTGYTNALDNILRRASQAVADGNKVLVLSDSAVSPDRVAVSSLLATGLLHHHLVSNKWRSRVAIVVHTGEAREVHHFCVLLGYGADAICPYLALECVVGLRLGGLVSRNISDTDLVNNYKTACGSGILATMSKVGISTLQSYKGAQIFEALGIDDSVIDKCFPGTTSRIKGLTFELIANDALRLHTIAYPSFDGSALSMTNEMLWNSMKEPDINDALSIAHLQDGVRSTDWLSYDAFSRLQHTKVRDCTIRGLLEFDTRARTAIPLNEVEPWTEIVRRFTTGAVSYGSLSIESHTTLIKAMNRLGARSNSGEGGVYHESATRVGGNDSNRPTTKQIAPGRFGVTSLYLANAQELQIKLAQGASPGEGGHLPASKVSTLVSQTRRTSPGIALTSPPSNHDVYSIEDLKQLVYDLKCSNPRSRISVKLVSEAGIGVVASGVSKAQADHILISGHDGGTAAAAWSGIKYAGLPWEIGLAEAHQSLVLNDLRGLVTLQVDGQIRTGRDVAISALLGAEEWAFATAPLIAMGCKLVRQCHLNTCPEGIATQDPELRKKFKGTPGHVFNYFYFVAVEMRQIMAQLGFRTVDDMVGRAEVLKVRTDLASDKLRNLDLARILIPAHQLRSGVATYRCRRQPHNLHDRLDNKLIAEAELSLEYGYPCHIECKVVNTDRSFGTTLSYHISKRYGDLGLPPNTIVVNVRGSAGQSFGAFLAKGVTLELEGDSNDGVGKGLSGGIIIVYPPKTAAYAAEDNVLVGNACLYGAASGLCFLRGIAAERFAVRNSGAIAVVEGAGDHCCEYMTGGCVVVLGETGRNFASGMSGGVAYVLDTRGDFESKVNHDTVQLTSLTDPVEISFFCALLEDHRQKTGSVRANAVLQDFDAYVQRIVRIVPVMPDARESSEDLARPTHKPHAVYATQELTLAGHLADEGGQRSRSIVDIEDSVKDRMSPVDRRQARLSESGSTSRGARKLPRISRGGHIVKHR